MDCKTAHDLLPLYFDGELDRATGRELETHLDGCAQCRAALIELDALRSSLRSDAPRYPAPTALRGRIQMQIPRPAADRARRIRSAWLPIAASLVLAFAAGAMLTSIWNTENRSGESTARQTQNQIVRDLFASHWRALAATSPVDVVSTDRHTVKPWFAGKVAQAPAVLDFADRGFALVGGRVDYVGAQRVPVLVYRHGQHLIDVFVIAQADSGAIGGQAVLQGYTLDKVALGDQSAAIVSDMDQAELSRFAQLLAAVR